MINWLKRYFTTPTGQYIFLSIIGVSIFITLMAFLLILAIWPITAIISTIVFITAAGIYLAYYIYINGFRKAYREMKASDSA